MSGRIPSKASPRRKEVQHRKRSGFSRVPHNWLGTMAPPQAPAKRHTAVVSKLAIGITARLDFKVSILDTFIWVCFFYLKSNKWPKEVICRVPFSSGILSRITLLSQGISMCGIARNQPGSSDSQPSCEFTMSEPYVPYF